MVPVRCFGRHDVFLGLDLGTGSLKAILLGGDGQAVVSASVPYTVHVPAPGWAQVRWGVPFVPAVGEAGWRLACLTFS